MEGGGRIFEMGGLNSSMNYEDLIQFKFFMNFGLDQNLSIIFVNNVDWEY